MPYRTSHREYREETKLRLWQDALGAIGVFFIAMLSIVVLCVLYGLPIKFAFAFGATFGFLMLLFAS